MRYLREGPRANDFWRRVSVAGLALGSALGIFLLLPFIQAITSPPAHDLTVRQIDSAEILPPPPPPPESIEEEEDRPEEPPPDLREETAMLNLAELELSLNTVLGGGPGAGEIAVRLETSASPKAEADALFTLADLDQKPRPVYQPSPILDAGVRKKTPGSVVVLFIVDLAGRVQEAMVQRSTDKALEAPVLAAVKKWKFEPGQRKGKPVRFRMRVPITFPGR